MISIIPTLEIMKSVTDNNIDSDNSNYRRIAFDKATELMTLAAVDVILEGNLYTKLGIRLNESHKAFFESVYRIDNSARGVENYNITKSIKWVAKSECKIRNVIIITDNKDEYEGDFADDTVSLCSPQEFIHKIELAFFHYKKKRFTSLFDALIVVFFVADNCKIH